MKAYVPVEIRFKSKLYEIKDWTILPVPTDESAKLPTRSQNSVTIAINGHERETVLEPDGYGSHWVRVDDDFQKIAGVKSGNVVDVVIITRKDWPEPKVPKDLADALKTAPQKVKDKWQDITPMARWEWIRWMNATLSSETRAVRIEKTISKLNGKHRRPCCFNLAACTEPYVAKGARLMGVDDAKTAKVGGA